MQKLLIISARQIEPQDCNTRKMQVLKLIHLRHFSERKETGRLPLHIACGVSVRGSSWLCLPLREVIVSELLSPFMCVEVPGAAYPSGTQ